MHINWVSNMDEFDVPFSEMKIIPVPGDTEDATSISTQNRI